MHLVENLLDQLEMYFEEMLDLLFIKLLKHML